MITKRYLLLTAGLFGFALGSSPALAQNLTQADVEGVIARVVNEANAEHTPATVAVVDRSGAVLAVYQMAGAPTSLPVVNNPHGPNATVGVDGVNGANLPTTAEAISKAITGAYLSSSNGNAFSTRTASQIVQDHFNPGTANASSGPLYGVQFSSLPCSDMMVHFNPYVDGTSLTRGPHRSPLGLAADPGGFPLYKNGALVGGVGVKAAGSYAYDPNIQQQDYYTDELLAIAGTFGLDAPAGIRADSITVGGLLLRYSDVSAANLATNPANAPPYSSLPFGLVNVPGFYYNVYGVLAGSTYGTTASGIVADTTGTINAQTEPYLLVDGYGFPRYPAHAGSGPSALTQAEVLSLLRNAYSILLQTRAQIRNPAGVQHAAVTVSVVDIYGNILGEVSAPDAPFFGIDVSLQKARSAAYLSFFESNTQLQAFAPAAKFVNAANNDSGRLAFGSAIAWSARAIGNIHRDTLPDGINGSINGPLSLSAALTTPFSVGLQEDLIIPNLLDAVGVISGASNYDPDFCTTLPPYYGAPANVPVLANGMQIFPGGFPIFRGQYVVGGIGVSGDGVDQDDMISFLGLYNAGQSLKTINHAPLGQRSSSVPFAGVEPHYVNCPFQPFLNSSATNVCSNK